DHGAVEPREAVSLRFARGQADHRSPVDVLFEQDATVAGNILNPHFARDSRDQTLAGRERRGVQRMRAVLAGGKPYFIARRVPGNSLNPPPARREDLLFA